MADPDFHLDDPDTDVFVGGCRDVLKSIPKDSVDLIFADPACERNAAAFWPCGPDRPTADACFSRPVDTPRSGSCALDATAPRRRRWSRCPRSQETACFTAVKTRSQLM